MWREINPNLYIVKRGIALPNGNLVVAPACHNDEPVYVVWDSSNPDNMIAEFCEDLANDRGDKEVITKARDYIEPLRWRRIIGTNGGRWWITCSSRTTQGVRMAPCITDWGAIGYCCYFRKEALCYRLLYRYDRGWKHIFWRIVSVSTLMDAMRELEEDKEANNVAQERQYCNC